MVHKHRPDPLTALKNALRDLDQPQTIGKSDKQRIAACWSEIQQKRAAGWKYVDLHAELVRLGGFQGTYRTFYKYVRAHSPTRTVPKTPTNAPVNAVATSPEPLPTAALAPSESAPGRPRLLREHGCGPHVRAYYEEMGNSSPSPSKPSSLIEKMNKKV